MLLSDILPKVAQLHPFHPAMKCGNQVITYIELQTQVAKVANGLKQCGTKPGDRIALIGNPCPKLVIAEYAAVVIGAIPFAIFPSLAPVEIQYILEDAAPLAVIYDMDSIPVEKQLSCSSVKLQISCELSHCPYSLVNFINEMPHQVDGYEADPREVALLIYTGGTTGRSKGVMHTHYSIMNWSFMNPESGIGHSPDHKTIVINLAHLTGQFTLWNTILRGGCLIFAEVYPIAPETVVSIIEREQVTSLGTVGLLLRDIVHLENIKHRDLHSVRFVGCGGATISLDTLYKTKEVFSTAQIVEVYSQTESGNFISYLPVNQCISERVLSERLLSVGNPSNMTLMGQKEFDIRIVDDVGKEVPQGNVGEIICRGEQIMIGYWNKPEETNKAIIDGWLYTGDIGRLDENGYLYLLDRKKDMIIVNGANVYCSEVEIVLGKHPAILEIAVVGTPLSEGEEITAVIVLCPGKEITLEDIKHFCINQLASFKVPTRLEIMDYLPRTIVGKLNKTKIRELYLTKRT